MIRSLKRNIAKNMMRDMGIEHINTRMGELQDPTDKHSPKMWRRVFEGDLNAEAVKCAKKAALQRKKLHEAG